MTTQVTTETPLIMVDGERILIRRPHDNEYAEFGSLGKDIEIPKVGTVNISGNKEDGYTVSADIMPLDPTTSTKSQTLSQVVCGKVSFRTCDRYAWFGCRREGSW